jgi:hypothetical protein
MAHFVANRCHTPGCYEFKVHSGRQGRFGEPMGNFCTYLGWGPVTAHRLRVRLRYEVQTVKCACQKHGWLPNFGPLRRRPSDA